MGADAIVSAEERKYSFLVSMLHPAHQLYTDLVGDYHDLLRPVVLYALALTIIHCLAAGGRGGAKVVEVGVRGVVSMVVLENYPELMNRLAWMTDGWCASIRARAEYRASLAQFLENASDFVSEADGIADAFVGLVKGTGLAMSGVFTHWTVPAAVHAVNFWTGMFFLISYVFGPLMIVANVFEDGKYFRNWMFVLTNVLLWPVFANFVMLVNAYIENDFQVARDNLASAASSNTVLAVTTLGTPIVVAMFLRTGGIASLGALAWGMALKTAASALSAAAGQVLGHLPLKSAASGGSGGSGDSQMAWRIFPQGLQPGGGGQRFDLDDGDLMFSPSTPRPLLPPSGGSSLLAAPRVPPALIPPRAVASQAHVMARRQEVNTASDRPGD